MAAIALAGACTSESRGSSPIAGTFTTEFLTRTGVITRPTDLSQHRFTAFVTDEGGALVAYPDPGDVTGRSDGTFVIPDVPEGPFLLRSISTSQSDVSWSQYDTRPVTEIASVVGDPDAAPMTKPTPLAVQATGLAGWTDTDLIVADCFDNGSENYDVAFDPTLVTGATQIDATFDWNDPVAYSWNLAGTPSLMTADDTLVLSHIAFHTDPNQIQVGVVTQTMSVLGVAQVDGASAAVSGGFTDVSLDKTIVFNADLDSLAAAVPGAASWYVSALTSPGSSRDLQDGPSLVSASGATGPGLPSSGLATTGPISYGDPFDPSWPILIAGGYSVPHDIVLPASSLPWRLSDNVFASELLAGDSYTLRAPAPRVTATLADIPLDERFVAWDGLAPLTLHVDLPEGVAGFRATVYRFTPRLDGFTLPDRILYIDAGGSNITLPVDGFDLGHYYAFVIDVGTESLVTRTTLGKILLAPAEISICGDGVVDPATGEICDDGNAGGCSATCR